MTSHSPQPHILLVEDEAHVHKTLLRRLEAENYQVTLATTYAQARELLAAEHFHIAILDVNLDSADEVDRSGYQLLKEIAALDLAGVMPCIIVTAYGTMSMAVEALKHLGAEDFIDKKPGYISLLLDAIREALGKHKLYFGLQYVADTHQKIEQGAHFIRSEETGWPAPDRLIPQIEDVLGKLFYGAKRLWINHTYAGLSGSFVLEAHPTWPTGLGQSMIVKIVRRAKARTEEENYQRYVEHFLPSRHATHLNSAYTRHLGGLLYTFVEMEAEDAVTFGAYYRSHTPEQISDALHRLFTHTCRLWYQGRTPPDNESLRDLYLEAFNLSSQPDRLAREIASLRPEYAPGDPTISFLSPNVMLPNPLHWLARDEATVMPVCRSITHGDLQADNILMNDAGDCWLIDYYRTCPSHILRDFIELETDIKFRLLDDVPPEEFASLEVTLIELQHPIQALALPGSLPETAQKAAQVIAGLRAEAWRLLDAIQPNVRLIQREYLTGLLLGTLNILRLRHFKEDPALQPRRELALLSAAMICQHLQ